MGIDTVRLENCVARHWTVRPSNTCGSWVDMADQRANRQFVECVSRAGWRYRYEHDAYHDFRLEQIKDSGEKHAGKMVAMVAKGALMGARGNSGVILSQLWRGFARATKDSAIIDADAFVCGLLEARDTAYKGVVKPVEGTILTVAKDTATTAEAALAETHDPIEILARNVPAADASVNKLRNCFRSLSRRAWSIQAARVCSLFWRECCVIFMASRSIRR